MRDNNYHEAAFDRIAVNAGTLSIVSILTDSQRLKAIRSVLGGSSGRVRVTAAGVDVRRPCDPEWNTYAAGNMRDITCDSGGYWCHVHRIGYGLAHGLFIVKTTGFMPVLDNNSLWNELSQSSRFTTPMLKEWVPYIREELERRGLIDWCKCYRLECGYLSCSDTHLDDIVSQGLKAKRIEIPRPDIVDASFRVVPAVVPAIESNPTLALENHS